MDGYYSWMPQGSILGPLIFNIYLNDIFYLIDESKLANYADDNTPYSIECSVESVVSRLGDNVNLNEVVREQHFYHECR